ncbi:short chain dehydrogenase [Ceratobasidium sp. AG-Ba]|nr:short chain dehydrogenase [Ceratobasidium sp. AG-Ba]QRW13841.1 short chain dehydrogenase [Ceratobasidium sp. AG-Ba]
MGVVTSKRPVFTVDQIPDLTGQVTIVTGGNTGIGKETCKALLEKNAKVYLAARSKPRADDAIEWLKNETNGKEAVFLELDLGSFASIRKAAEEFKSKEQNLHVLFNNAGVCYPPIEQKTADGYDLCFGTNQLGHFYFTRLLLPTLLDTAQSVGHARVVHTASGAVQSAPKGGIVWETLGKDQASFEARKRLGRFPLYAQSKLANVLFSNELARRYKDQGIISIAVDPGIINTEVARHVNLPDWFKNFVMGLLFHPASKGALSQLYAGTSPDTTDLNGKWIIPWAAFGEHHPLARDEKLAEKLWMWCEEHTKEK